VVEIDVVLLADAAAPSLEVTIQDDGPGIPPEQRMEALARGGRVDESVPGSGLGLAIVDDLARLYGGALDLDTSPLGGLRARIRLPAMI
jgi:signal transduction histidine kinase